LNRKGAKAARGKGIKETNHRVGIMRFFLEKVALIDLGLFVTAIPLCVFGGFRFSTAIIGCGVAMLILGSMAAIGGESIAPGEYNLKFDQKLPQFKFELTPEKFNDMRESYNFYVYLAAASVLPILTGLLINYFSD
jgi:hypothetical protein